MTKTKRRPRCILIARSKRCRQDDVRHAVICRKRGGGPLRQCRSHSEWPVALETGNRPPLRRHGWYWGNWIVLVADRADFRLRDSAQRLTYVHRLKSWKRAGYRIDIVYLKLSCSRLALRRVAARVRQAATMPPQADVLRRFVRGWDNFQRVYRSLADRWAVYDNSGRAPQLLEKD